MNENICLSKFSIQEPKKKQNFVGYLLIACFLFCSIIAGFSVSVSRPARAATISGINVSPSASQDNSYVNFTCSYNVNSSALLSSLPAAISIQFIHELEGLFYHLSSGSNWFYTDLRFYNESGYYVETYFLPGNVSETTLRVVPSANNNKTSFIIGETYKYKVTARVEQSTGYITTQTFIFTFVFMQTSNVTPTPTVTAAPTGTANPTATGTANPTATGTNKTTATATGTGSTASASAGFENDGANFFSEIYEKNKVSIWAIVCSSIVLIILGILKKKR